PSGACAQGTVTLNVLPVNDPPVAVSVVLNGASGDTLTERLHGIDADGDRLTYNLVVAPSHGRVESLRSDGLLTYVADPEYVGPVIGVFSVCDIAGDCSLAMFQIFLSRPGGGGALSDRSNLVISEVAWTGASSGDELEWIELRNMGSSTVVLDDWVLRWRRKVPTESHDRVWQTVELAGLVAKAQVVPQPRWREPGEALGLQMLEWDVLSADDLYLVEWRSDETVADVAADLIVDHADVAGFSLHDEGDVLQLMDPLGRIIDTANASPNDVLGWAAGSLSTHATMERTDPLGPDAPDNWHTNLGVVRFGSDPAGSPIFGTPRFPNSPVLAALSDRAGVIPTRRNLTEDLVIMLRDPEGWSIDPEMWFFVAISRSQLPRSIESPVLIAHTADGRIEVQIAIEDLPRDAFDLWIRTPSGDVFVAAISPA
ncbi:hypothetical protein JW848_07165, partial [Candidatus Bipolaricaulota bacterium]|nr:hypothetical protein [Candidatus Bipolaricaulota bacterium]